MHWNSFSDFIHMGGYGLYVWGSYAMVLAGMLLETALATGRHRRAKARVGQGDAT